MLSSLFLSQMPFIEFIAPNDNDLNKEWHKYNNNNNIFPHYIDVTMFQN